jgi:hypothetical protein
MQSAYQTNIQQSQLSIYDQVQVGDPKLWIPTNDLESLLVTTLKGLSLKGLPLRTRSKILKSKVCEAMGYAVPSSFKRTQPRFPGQNLDMYAQKSRNLQIWNEEISPARRYAIIAIDEDDRVTTVKVVNGDALAKLDTTGTLTQKYQARVNLAGNQGTHLLTEKDTENLQKVLGVPSGTQFLNPAADPETSTLLPIENLFLKLESLVGITFSDIGSDQERNRGAILHEYVSKALGYTLHQDNGQFPDIRHQLLEIKLQTSPTIDLGLVSPDSTEPLDTQEMNGTHARHCDVRYAVFGASIRDRQVEITHLFLTNGEDFYSHFRQFQGKILNKKLQIPLPVSFFN